MSSHSEVIFPKTLKIPGGQAPKGVVRVSGAKNSGTRLLAAASLTDENVVLTNFPTKLVDAQHKIRFLREVGFSIDVDYETEELHLSGGDITSEVLDSYILYICML